MKIFAPKYYTDFKCIGSICKHNCCIGWEIDIDNDTYEKYKNIKDEFGNKLEKNISFDGEIASFKLLENERCPFLNDNNLCDIILTLGEDKLCQICSDHPRFRNFYSDRIEMGLGLCCEEAARIIISQNKPFKLVEIDENNDEKFVDINELEFIDIRNKIFEILQSNDTLKSKIQYIFHMFDIEFPKKTLSEWADIYLSLEILDDNWKKALTELKTSENFAIHPTYQFDKWFENLLIYFIYRHLSESIYDGNFKKRIVFSAVSCYIIYLISVLKYNNFSIDDLIEISRMYSSEIEYSDENINFLIKIL